ncbi:DUF3795 domain-containing protein [Anaerocolumna sp. MB42-C2]
MADNFLREDICKGCIETDGNCKEWSQSGGCPIYKCANKHNVSFLRFMQ